MKSCNLIFVYVVRLIGIIVDFVFHYVLYL